MTALQKPYVQFIFYFPYIHIMDFVILLVNPTKQSQRLKRNTTDHV